jgi:Phage capsid family
MTRPKINHPDSQPWLCSSLAIRAKLPLMSTSASQSFAERYRRDGTSVLVRAAICHLLAEIEGGFANEIGKRLWPEDRDLTVLQRATVSPATMTNQSSLVASAVSDLFKSMGGASAGSQVLSRGMRLNFDGKGPILVPSLVASADNASFVGEAAPIPAHMLAFGAPTLAPRKFGSLMVYTREMLSRSTPNVEAVVRAVLTESTALALDVALFSNTAGDAIRPPGLLNGISALPASTATSPSEAMSADIATLASAVAPIAGNGPIIFIASPARSVRFKVKRDNISYEVLTSAALADGVLIAVAGNAVASAMDPLPRFNIADEATLHMADNPGPISATGTPNSVVAPVRNLWQTDSIGLRMLLEIGWTLRNPAGVAWISGATW